MAVSSEIIYDKLLVKYPTLKTLRILSWIKRFLINRKKQEERRPLKSSEIKTQRGHIQGECPIFIPRDSKLAEKLIEEAHSQTIHGGVTLIMTKI